MHIVYNAPRNFIIDSFSYRAEQQIFIIPSKFVVPNKIIIENLLQPH